MIPAFIWPGYSQAGVAQLVLEPYDQGNAILRTAPIETGKEKVIAFPGVTSGYIFWRDSPSKAAPKCLWDNPSP